MFGVTIDGFVSRSYISRRGIFYDEVMQIRRGCIVYALICQKKDLIFDAGFNWKPMQFTP